MFASLNNRACVCCLLTILNTLFKLLHTLTHLKSYFKAYISLLFIHFTVILIEPMAYVINLNHLNFQQIIVNVKLGLKRLF